jgi:hypothetical protein
MVQKARVHAFLQLHQRERSRWTNPNNARDGSQRFIACAQIKIK